MRWLKWRRAVAIIAAVVGLGVGVSTGPASATPSHRSGGTVQTANDWWWE